SFLKVRGNLNVLHPSFLQSSFVAGTMARSKGATKLPPTETIAWSPVAGSTRMTPPAPGGPADVAFATRMSPLAAIPRPTGAVKKPPRGDFGLAPGRRIHLDNPTGLTTECVGVCDEDRATRRNGDAEVRDKAASRGDGGLLSRRGIDPDDAARPT